ncbi:type II toxin-antitoxin system ParD family antitoxin [Rhizobium sp. XQZ8]|uniref:type II toxin-antitoxin system ParD family antitoxin n=1 Tax=Rhizobium populisoli TaxID=2859785 RepID=UPI001CA4B226|nr:type II toxin-antitoxin system ParD family antitoxin [Rhizobium populisoli]MBW6420556.1 type II toxin-antitoxin system ParD family antitoxin [Rhizobium populisoli]
MTEIHLSDKDKSFIEEQVRAGTYKDADEVVAAGLSRLGSENELLSEMIAEADAQFERGEYRTFTTADALADSIIERGMRILNRKS